MIPDHRQAETVNRRNLRIVYQSGLLLEMLVTRVFFQFLLNGIADTFLHLRRRCLRKCYDQQPIYRAFILREHGNNAFHQDGRLARACRS